MHAYTHICNNNQKEAISWRVRVWRDSTWEGLEGGKGGDAILFKFKIYLRKRQDMRRKGKKRQD